MDGLLIVDKPSGPTSHDVVARVRRALGERRVGHTGTLDPLATGVLPLVVGRATRLAQFLSSGDKTYDATVDLGVATDTRDALGRALGLPFAGPPPTRAQIEAALDQFRGTFLQEPPAFSAKKIGGRRSYDLARAVLRRGRSSDAPGAQIDGVTAADGVERPTTPPQPISVTAHAIDLIEVTGARLTLRVRCSAGFYVRSLAHDLGVALTTGAHLSALRRTESARARIEEAVALEAVERDGLEAAGAAWVPLERMVPWMPCLALTADGVLHARSGRDLRPADAVEGFPAAWRRDGCPSHVRLLDTQGRLVGVAAPATTDGALHAGLILM